MKQKSRRQHIVREFVPHSSQISQSTSVKGIFILFFIIASMVHAEKLLIDTDQDTYDGLYISQGTMNGKPYYKHQTLDYYLYAANHYGDPGWFSWHIYNQLLDNPDDGQCYYIGLYANSLPQNAEWYADNFQDGLVYISVVPPSVTFTDGFAFSPGNATANTNNNVIGRFYLQADDAGASLTAAAISVAGIHQGVNNLKLWSSSDNTFDSGSDTQLDSRADGVSVSFSGFSSSISTAGTYYFVTTDLAPNASGSLTLTIGSQANLTLNNGTFSSNFTNAVLSSGAISITAVSEINIRGNGVSILNNDITPDPADDTDFGRHNIVTGSNANIFTIENLGAASLNLTDPSPYVTITGHTSDFTLTSIPSGAITGESSTPFEITFNPTITGTRSATISIANSDGNENPYTFYVQGEGYTPPTGANDTVTVNEDKLYTFDTADFTFNDIDGGAFDGIQIASVETAGDLEYNGVDASAGLNCPDVTLLTFMPAPDANGSPYASFTFRVRDDEGDSSIAIYTLTINVTAVNDPPTISDIENRTVLEDYSTGWIPVTVNDKETDPALLILRGVSMNQTIVPNTDIRFSGNGANRLLKVRHTPNQYGTVEIRIFVSDGELEKRMRFYLTIKSVNDAPRITHLPNIIFKEDSTAVIDMDSLVYDADHRLSRLKWTAIVLDTVAIPGEAPPDTLCPLIVTIDDTTHLVEFSAFINHFGSHDVVFVVTDPDGGMDQDTCQVIITPVNDPPHFIIDLPPLFMVQGMHYSLPLDTLYMLVEDPDNPDSTLIWSLEGNERFSPTIFDDSVMVTAPEDWVGTDTIVIVVSDGELSDSKPIDVTVLSPFNITQPATPQNLTALPDKNVIHLQWEANTDPDMASYHLFRGTDPSDMKKSSLIANVIHPVHFWDDSTAEQDVIYYYCVAAIDSRGNWSSISPQVEALLTTATGIQKIDALPTEFSLAQNFPNPFNLKTQIRFGIPVKTHVQMTVFDILGRQVAELVNEIRQPGMYQLELDASQMETGIYFIRINTAEFKMIKKCTLIK